MRIKVSELRFEMVIQWKRSSTHLEQGLETNPASFPHLMGPEPPELVMMMDVSLQLLVVHDYALIIGRKDLPATRSMMTWFLRSPEMEQRC